MRKTLLKEFSVLPVCTLILLGAVILFHPASANAGAPNIILINVDNMGWGDFKPDGSDPAQCKQAGASGTPCLQKLASSGVTLSNFYTPTPICSPSRAALMTGRDPQRHEILSALGGVKGEKFLQADDAKFTTLAKALGAANYNTAIIGKWHLGWDDKPDCADNNSCNCPHGGCNSWNNGFQYNYVMPYGIGQTHNGFCLVEKTADGINPQIDQWYYISNILTDTEGNEQYLSVGGETTGNCDKDNTSKMPFSIFSIETSLTQILTNKAKDYINEITTKENTKSSPFFLYLAYPAPHSPLYVHLKQKENISVPAGFICDTTPCTPKGVRDGCLKNTCKNAADPTDCVRNCEMDILYPAVIKEIDVNVGDILKSLDETLDQRNSNQPLKNNTIVIFTSDNGPYVGENNEYWMIRSGSTGGLKGGQKINYEGGVRVPFIARWPSNWPSDTTAVNAKSDNPADMMDILPTLISSVSAAICKDGKLISDATTPCPIQSREETVTAKDKTTNIDGKDMSSVLKSPNTTTVPKDIHISWHGADTYDKFCVNWTTTWQTTGYCTSPESTKDDPDRDNHPYAIRSNNPGSILLNDLNKTSEPLKNYKLYFDYFLQPRSLFNISENPEETADNYVENDRYSTIRDALIVKAQEYQRERLHYLPSLKDQYQGSWQNIVTVTAKEPVSMNVNIRLYDMAGNLLGEYRYCDAADSKKCNASAVAPFGRLPIVPSGIYSLLLDPTGKTSYPYLKEYSMIIATSAASIVNTRTSANYFAGFDIYEAPKARSKHVFAKNFDGPNLFQGYLLIQNVYNTKRNVTIKLLPKNPNATTACGYQKVETFDINNYATLKIRPSDIAGGCDFNGTVEVYSNDAVEGTKYLYNTTEGVNNGFGVGLPIPALNRFEVGTDALTIYESPEPQTKLYFPHIKDGVYKAPIDNAGKEGEIDFQNTLSVVNPNPIGTLNGDANITIILYSNNGKEEKRLTEVIPAAGKKSWRPSQIYGTVEKPVPFEGSLVVLSNNNIPVIGQTNVLYPFAGTSVVNAFSLYESAIPASKLFFPKAYDNLQMVNHLADNFAYIQNPDDINKKINIELINSDGTMNGGSSTLSRRTPPENVTYNSDGTVTLGPNVTFSFRPKDLVTDGSGTFNGTVKVTETSGQNITGVFKYEIHGTDKGTSKVDAITIYRSVGQ